MSSLSDQQPGSPFSEYSDLCKVSSLTPTVSEQSWDWQHPSAMDMGPPRSLVPGDRPLAQTGLTDEDKLCFFEHPSRGGVDAELKVPGIVGGISGSTSLGNASLGSAGESPDSPLSSSPFPSPASPGRLPSAQPCSGISRASLPPVPGSPVRSVELPLPNNAMAPHSIGASPVKASPVDGDSPNEQWKSSSFAESSPKIAMPQVAPNYCVIGVVNDNHLERGGEKVGGAGAALGAQKLCEGSSGDNSDEEEIEEEEEMEPCFMGRAEQQRKAMRRAMSECSHLSVPTSLELPDKYPSGDEAELDQLVSPLGGPRRPPHSMKRSLTVAEDQPQTPPPTLSAAGATHTDLRQAPPEPRLCLSPFPPLRDGNAGSPLSPLDASMEGFRVEKEPGGIVLPVPLSPKGFSGMDASSAQTVGANMEGETGIKSDMFKDAHLEGKEVDTKVNTGAYVDFGAGNLTVAGGIDDDFTMGGYTNLGLTSSTNPFITMDVKSDKMSEKKEEILEDSVKKTGHFEPLNKADQRGVKVEYASTETPAKVEKETEKEKQTDTEKEKEVKIEDDKKVKPKEAEEVKETDKQAEKVEEMKKETEKGKEKETEKVESMQQKEDEMTKAEESVEISVKTEKVEKVEMEEKVESKPEKTENIDKMDKSEKVKVEEKPENKNIEKLEKTAIKDDKEHIDKVEKTPEPQPTPVKIDTSSDKVEKEADRETKEADTETKEADKETKEADRETKETDRETKATAEVQENKKEKADADKAQKMEKEGEVEKPSEKPAEKPEQKSEKQEKQDQIQDEKKSVEKKDDKKDKAAKADVGEKVKKSKPLANGSSVAPNKDVAGADKKTKSGTGLTKPSAAAKMRPSSAAASSGSLAAPSKRPTPSSTTFTSDRKATTARAPSTATAGPKRPSTTPSSRLSLSATTSTTRDVKPKTTTEKRPLVPKASTATSNLTGPTAATKNGTATTAASKTTTSVRTSLTTRTSTTAAKKPLAPKTNSKPGDEKKPSTLKTTAADSTKPKTTTTTRSAGATTTTTTASRARTTAAKPATPSSSTVPEKKPLVPRAPRASFSSTTTATSKTATRPSTAPAPDIRNARSKIGSTDNMKHQPGGGKVSSASQSRAVASKDTSQGKVQILNKKVDLSKVTSKCGSKDNIKHKPGGGDVKIGSHKVNFREKAQSKVGSTDNLSHSPGGGNIKAEGGQETTEGNGTPLSGTQAPAPGFEPGQAGDLAAHENGLKDGAPCDSESLREPQALDSSIPETN